MPRYADDFGPFDATSGVHIAERDQKLRISPHLYNTRQDIEKVTGLLAQLA